MHHWENVQGSSSIVSALLFCLINAAKHSHKCFKEKNPVIVHYTFAQICRIYEHSTPQKNPKLNKFHNEETPLHAGTIYSLQKVLTVREPNIHNDVKFYTRFMHRAL